MNRSLGTPDSRRDLAQIPNLPTVRETAKGIA